MIGRVLSAESTLKVGQREFSALTRFLLVGLPSVLLIAGGIWVSEHRRNSDRTSMFVVAFIAGASVAAAAWYLTQFRHRCTYVGEDGFAIYRLSANRTAKPTASVFPFARAAELRAAQTRLFVNGAYRKTSYDFRWVDDHGRRVAWLTGEYVGLDRLPKGGDPFNLAAAAEAAWSIHALARAEQQLRDEGSIPFRVDERRILRVGPGFIEFHFGDEPVRVDREEIGSVSLGGGIFSFKHKDAKWYRSAGKYSFGYGDMANGRVFLFALDKLMAYRSFGESASSNQ